MPETLYEAAWIFLIYAFLGWGAEVAFAALEKGTFINRGFLNGPVCPIYGVGMLIVVLVLWPLKNNVLLLFCGSALLTTALEGLTGLVLETIFHQKWWDYSGMPFNIKGYVCLKFTVLWGLAAAFVIGVIHPLIFTAIIKTPPVAGAVLLAVFAALFLTDLAITVAQLLKLPKKLNAMLELEKSLRALSDKIGESISETTLAAAEKGGELMEENKTRLEALKVEYAKKSAELKRLAESRNLVHNRIFKAFPTLKKGRYQAVFERIKPFKKQMKETPHDENRV